MTTYLLRFSPSNSSAAVLWPLLTSHSKSCFNRASYLMFPHVCEISHGKTINLHPIYPHHLQYYVRVIFGLRFVWQAHPHSVCLIVFVFLGPGLCRQLPSDSTSRWTPLLLANGWRLHAPITDLHRRVCRHAWRTTATPGADRWPGVVHML